MKTTTIIQPDYLTLDVWRNVVKRNRGIGPITFWIVSEEEWLPTILRDAGFFASNSQVRKNRPDLWRKREPYDVVRLKWATVAVYPMSADGALRGMSSGL